MTKRQFGELEMLIIKTLKELGNSASVKDVYSKLGSHGSYTTILTVMTRLAAKNELTREKQGNKYYYSLSKIPSKNLLKRIQEKIFGGKKSAMICYLIEEDSKLTENELQAIEELIRKKRLEG